MIQDINKPIRDFCYDMVQELETHDMEKEFKFYDMTMEQCRKMLEREFLKRIQIINQTEDKNEIKKQVTHLANYCYFVWSRSK